MVRLRALVALPLTFVLAFATVDLAVPASASAASVRVKATALPAIAKLAAKQVGRRYVEGGTAPKRGFDCSGLVTYTYKKAAKIRLPHSAQQQFKKARKISARKARPGDLVFFHDGSGHVYHVGIYAGQHRMYAAATVKDGVRFQSIWSRAITYGTFRHG
jgi:cell wall-associated NlpC family hydrolase